MRTLIAALIACLTALLSAGTAADAATPHHRTFVAQGYSARARAVRPAMLQLSGDGSFLVKGMHWDRWGARTAHGHGTTWLDDCNPNCAEGHYDKYPVTVTLSTPRHRCGHVFFSVIRMQYAGRHPRGVARDSQMTLFPIVC